MLKTQIGFNWGAISLFPAIVDNFDGVLMPASTIQLLSTPGPLLDRAQHA